MSVQATVTTPADPGLDELCDQLAELASQLDVPQSWPAHQLALCARYGVYRWFVPQEFGGQPWSAADILRGYLRLSAACLTTTFIVTQRMGACRRIAECEGNPQLKNELLPALAGGERFATVAISHLTTSRRHLAQPALRAQETPDGFRLDGYSPWVTGAVYADLIVTGATLPDGRQILLAIPKRTPGVVAGEPLELLALSASQTGPVRFEGVLASREWLLAGPAENVLQQKPGTGGLQTSALAAGLASSAIGFIELEAARRPDLLAVCEALRREWQNLQDDLLQAAGDGTASGADPLRARANSLALRAAHAALAAAKGAGFVDGHPAGRWCREALFFLVWSCPAPVTAASLCEFAGIR